MRASVPTVANVTQQRGPADTLTGPRTDIWGGVEPRLRPLLATMALALALHLPMLPTAFGYWFRMLFEDHTEEPDDGPQQEMVLPIDVDLLGDRPVSDERKASAASTPTPPLPEHDTLEAVDEAAPAPAPKPPPKAVATKPRKVKPKPTPLPKGKLKDTFDASGDSGLARAKHPNVNVLIAADILRRRDLSKDFTELLTAVPQWQELIGGTDIDPLRDFDRILISGPQFANPAWIVVAIRYNKRMSAYEMKRQVDKVVKRAGKHGRWLDKPLPTAVIGKKGHRLVVIVPNKRMLWILPKDPGVDLAQLADAEPFARTPSAGIVVDLKHPSKPMRKNRFPFPKSIKHLRVHFSLKGQSGYQVEAEGWDKSPREAKLHAATMKSALDALQLELPGFLTKVFGKKKLRVVGDSTFEVTGKRIYARADLSGQQLSRIIRFIKHGLAKRSAAQKKRKAKREAAKAARTRAKTRADRPEGGAKATTPAAEGPARPNDDTSNP